MGTQLSFEVLDDTLPNVMLNDISHGNCAEIAHNHKIIMRVKPTGFLLNSNVIGDVLNRGDCLVVDMAKGTLYVMKLSTEVIPLKSKLTYYPLKDI